MSKGVGKSCFLNVDLEITSASKLDKLVLEFGKRVCVLHSGPGSRTRTHFLSLEINRRAKNPDSTICAFCDLIGKLSPSAKRVWKAANKEFNVGYELRPSERFSQFSLRADTLQRIINVGGTLGVTYYRSEDSDHLKRKNKK